MTTYYTNSGSFNSHTFLESFDGGASSPEGDVTLAYTMYHIPGSDDNVMISTGKLHQTADIAIICTASELASLQGDVGNSTHTLVWHVGSTTARLVGVVGARKESGADVYRATLRVLY